MMNEVIDKAGPFSESAKIYEREPDQKSIASSGTLMSRTMRNRPQNEDRIRGLPEKPALGRVPVHLLGDVIKSITKKHGGNITEIHIRHAGGNLYETEYRLIGGDE